MPFLRQLRMIHCMDSSKHMLVRPTDEETALRGLRVLVGGPEEAGALRAADVEEKIAGFLAYAELMNIDIGRQVLAVRPSSDSGSGGNIEGMCLWVPAPGRTAMLFAPPLSEYPQTAGASQAAIEGALADARDAGIVLVQVMMEPADAAGKTVFAAAGLTQLATLTYMERRPPVHPPGFVLPADLDLLPYEAATHGLFREAILASYEGTLDCPAMSDLRDIEDVIEGHKSVGVTGSGSGAGEGKQFDAQLWGVVVRAGRPVGCLLLAEIAARRALELVYLGLAPVARGRGLGRILMQRVLGIASRRGCELATLAVDAANAPAVRLYRRCGYTSVAQRVALVKRL